MKFYLLLDKALSESEICSEAADGLPEYLNDAASLISMAIQVIYRLINS